MGQNQRFSHIDALRGLIMMLMAIDHSNSFVSRQHGPEFWNGAVATYQSAAAFLTRFVTHLCAPGFFFLMGAGMYWFAASRRRAGWSEGAILKRLLLRGGALIVVGQLFETPIPLLQGPLERATQPLFGLPMVPPVDGTAPSLVLITLFGLGGVMILCALLQRLQPVWWAVAMAASVVATHQLLPADGKPGSVLITMFLAPAIAHHMISIYPVIPWLAVGCFGMLCGYWWQQHPEWRGRVALLGVGMILLASGVRLAGGWGNIVAARDTSWIEFLNNVKYPPSLVFWTMSVGIDLVLLGLLSRFRHADNSPLLVFGQTPLFFYVVHFYLLIPMGLMFFRKAAPLGMTYVVWLVVLAIMYPLCRWYRGFKNTKPEESLWRMF